MSDTMPKKIIRCGFRSGFIIGFSFALVCIQIVAFSRVSNVLFEGESSAPEHHEAFTGNTEVVGKNILGLLPREAVREVRSEALFRSEPNRRSREIQSEGIVMENKEGNVRFPAVQDNPKLVRSTARTTEEHSSDSLATSKDTVSLDLQKTLSTAQIHTESPPEQDVSEELEEVECDFQSNADALSALSRASSPKCKNLIRNVTCLQMKNELYDLNIHNTCPHGIGFLGDTLPTDPLPLDSAPHTPVRILYVLIVHGRALRQVKMLLKALYHRDHYFYIHVDARADYLHREVLPIADLYPNVLVTPWRLATIWGGASLLQMLLRAMADVDKMADWKWDYFINLSAADYPLKSDQELRKFLSIHKGKNFVKTHRRDTTRFIQKQGLDRTFVECDNHMWRLGKRPLPQGAVIDGGSDWIILHRDFVHYLVNSRDQYLTALKRYFEFTLLPAESFFHTVLRNGKFCTTLITSNLHVLNWKREIGCSCQYKQVVDWCGCSPNDFLPSDANWLMNVKQDYFARKFEPAVSHEVVLKLDAHLYGEYLPDTPGLHSYWESVYHCEDQPSVPGDAAYTLYSSFKRHLKDYLDKMIPGKCTVHIPASPVIHEVSALFMKDQFLGYIVTVQDEVDSKRVGPLYQIYMKRQSHVINYVEDMEGDTAKRLVSVQVGSKWDTKERIFRDFGGIVGPYNDIVLGMIWKKGAPFDFTVEWTDPTGQKREKNVRAKVDTTALTDKVSIPKPLKPGVWSVKVTMGKMSPHVLMETTFLVVPLTHHSDKFPLVQPWKTNGVYVSTSEAQNGVSEEELSDWKKKVQLHGEELDKFVDSLVGQFWHEMGVCVLSNSSAGDSALCPSSVLPDCRKTTWSTFSPDVKSELNPVKDSGYIR